MCVVALMLATKAVGCVIVADFVRTLPVADVTVTVYVSAVRPVRFCVVAVKPPPERDQLYVEAASPEMVVVIVPLEPALHETSVFASEIVNVRTVQLSAGFGVYPIDALFPLPLRHPLVPLSYVRVPV
jgi:hypothetical protein